MSDANLEKLVEHFDLHIKRMSPDFLREVYGWNSLTRPQKRKNTLPYWDERSLGFVRDVGRTIATKPTGISAISKLVSYTVGNGHIYKVAARQPALTNARELKRQQKEAARMQLELDVQIEVMIWQAIQIETYLRLVRDGECFRRRWLTGDGIDITYIEPEDVGQPTAFTEIDMSTVPDFIRALWDGTTPPGELGIISDPTDVRRVLGYWVKNEDRKYEFISAQTVQHLKDGVDSNDPRGVPRFYWAFCHVLGVDEIEAAMRDLFLQQAKHAAVYNYEQSSLISDIKRLASRQQEIETRENDGRPASPGVVHAKGFTVEVPGINVAARDAVEIIQQEQRLVGGVSDIPEHLISEDANTGNRSSLVAAEGPFDRRIQREQLYMWRHDRPLLWQILASSLNWSIATAQEHFREFAMTPSFPKAYARDVDKNRESVALLVDKQLMSIKQGQSELGINSDQTEHDLVSQPPLEVDGNNMPSQTRNQSPATQGRT